MNHGSLFSGIGGFDLAAEWMGWNNVFHCEINKKSREKLNYYWPRAASYADIKSTNFTFWRGKLDILTGGDPCQPSSVAGLGKGTSDDRYLWPEMFRAAVESESPWIVNENVNGTVSNGILDIKITDLESKGYACWPFSIPAEAVGALHQRERIWLVAYNADFDAARRDSRRLQEQEQEQELQERHHFQHSWEPVDLRAGDTDSNRERFKEQHNSCKSADLQEGVSRYFGFGSDPHGDIPRHVIESGIIRMLNGLPEGMDYTERNQRIKELGNAIVPQVAYEIFKAIEKYEQCENEQKG